MDPFRYERMTPGIKNGEKVSFPRDLLFDLRNTNLLDSGGLESSGGKHGEKELPPGGLNCSFSHRRAGHRGACAGVKATHSVPQRSRSPPDVHPGARHYEERTVNTAAKAPLTEVAEQGPWGEQGNKYRIPGTITLDNQPRFPPFSLTAQSPVLSSKREVALKCQRH